MSFTCKYGQPTKLTPFIESMASFGAHVRRLSLRLFGRYPSKRALIKEFIFLEFNLEPWNSDCQGPNRTDRKSVV